MTTKILPIKAEIQAASQSGLPNKIELTEAQMKFEDGVLTIRTKNPPPPTTSEQENKKKPKSGAERQRTLVQSRKEAGLVKDWVHKDILAMSKKFEKPEDFAVELDQLRARAEKAEMIAAAEKQRADAAILELEKLKAQKARWWHFWR